MSAEKHHHVAHDRQLESAREDAELAALEAERYPPFTWGYFLIVFGIGVVLLSFGVWGFVSPGPPNRPFSAIQYIAVYGGASFMAFAIAGRHLQTREDRKQRRTKV